MLQMTKTPKYRRSKRSTTHTDTQSRRISLGSSPVLVNSVRAPFRTSTASRRAARRGEEGGSFLPSGEIYMLRADALRPRYAPKRRVYNTEWRTRARTRASFLLPPGRFAPITTVQRSRATSMFVCICDDRSAHTSATIIRYHPSPPPPPLCVSLCSP